MTRPSKNLDKKMITAGKKIIIERGIDKLTISNICKTANVNSGMFSYHFGSKNEFLFELFMSVYQEFLQTIDIEKMRLSSSLARLKYCLLCLARFSIKRKNLISAMWLEVLKEKELVGKLIDASEKNIILNLIYDCKKEGCFDTTLPVLEIYAILILGGIHPSVISMSGTEENYEDAPHERLSIIFRGLTKKELL